MITEIDFKVRGEERKKLAYAIGELLGMPVKYTRIPKFDYLIGSYILDKNGVFHASEDLTESKLELVLERVYKGEPIQQSEQSENEIVEADVLSISVPRSMFADDKLENLQKLIEGKQTLFKHAFLTEQLEVVITENQVSFPWFPLASEPDAVNAYTEFISKLCELAIKLKRVSLTDKEVENEKYALTRDQMCKFLKFVHDDNVYCKYYEVVYILFHTGMRISEFCGLTIKDIDLEHRIVNIDHQLQRLSDMTLVIEPTKTSAGTRKLPITEDVAKCFQAIIEDREKPKVEKVVDGYTGFLFVDDKGLPLVAMHWEHRFNHMVKRYNDIYRVQMPNITPHICRHTYCSNMAKFGMNPKTLQYLMGHSDIGVTLNTYTHLGLEDAEDELKRLEDLQNARKELERTQGEKSVSQKMFKAI